ncbi:hypothetical protein PENTCL1PPCAC_1393, partial [Pristionchus entomophagus]
QLDVSTESIEIIEDEGNAPISSVAPSKSPSATIAAAADEVTEVAVTPRGNALYARLAMLMGKGVTVEEALTEMKEMSRQMAARKAAAGVTELWDAGEEVGEATAAAGGTRAPPKRIGPPGGALGASSTTRLQAGPSPADKRPARPSTATMDKSSSSGSEESQDGASSSAVGRAKASVSEIPRATSKWCIVCHEAASSSSQLLTCSVCTLPTHAKCAKHVDKEELASPRFVFTCASCTRRPRSESPKLISTQRSAIQITAPHDRRRKTEVSPKMGKSDEAKRKKVEGEVKKKKSEEL